MAVELEIRFTGTAPGVAEHRLSLSAFGPSLEKLLEAIRRIASSVVREAVEPDYGARGGRYTRDAELLDIQVSEIGDGSLKVAVVLALQFAAGTQAPLFEDLPERTGAYFVEAVEAEGRGEMRSGMVRRYLESLPNGLDTQQYSLSRDGQILKEVTLGDVSLASNLSDWPSLIEAEGQVAGVSFAPARPSVVVKIDKHTIRFAATADQVEKALELRSARVRVQAVMEGKVQRLTSIRDGAAVAPALTDEQRMESLFTRWDELLDRLAR